MPTLRTLPHFPVRVDSPRRTSSLPRAGSLPECSVNRRTVSFPFAVPCPHSCMDVNLQPQAPASPKRKVDDVDGCFTNSIRRTPTHVRESKRRRLAQPARNIVKRVRKRPVSKLTKARKAFLKRSKGAGVVPQPDPYAYPFCFPHAYPTDLQVLQQCAPHHFSPRAESSFVSAEVPDSNALLYQHASVSDASQVDFPMMSTSTYSLVHLSEPIGLGLGVFERDASTAHRIAQRAHQLRRAHATAKSRAAIDQSIKQSLPRAVRKALQSQKASRRHEEIRKAATPYLGSFEWKRRRAYHPVLRLAPLDIPIDMKERLKTLAAGFGPVEDNDYMEYEETISYDTSDSDDSMDVYFTPLPSYDMLSSVVSESAMDISSSTGSLAQLAHANEEMLVSYPDIAMHALPDFEEVQPDVSAQTTPEVQEPARATFLLDAILRGDAPAPVHASTPKSSTEIVLYAEDGDDDEDVEEGEEVWYDTSSDEAALLAHADAFLAIVGTELQAAGSSADSTATATGELFEELFGPEPGADEDIFGSPVVSGRNGESTRRAMQYRPVPGVSFDD